MRVLISILITAGLGMSVYYIFLKHASPAGTNAPITANISATGVQMDLSSIAEAERLYNAENGSYGTMDQLVSGGALPIAKTGRDGYAYTIDVTSTTFTVTAKWSPATPEQARFTYPAYVVDQTMQVRELQ